MLWDIDWASVRADREGLCELFYDGGIWFMRQLVSEVIKILVWKSFILISMSCIIVLLFLWFRL